MSVLVVMTDNLSPESEAASLGAINALDLLSIEALLFERGGGVGPRKLSFIDSSSLYPNIDTLSDGAMLCVAAEGDGESELREGADTRDSRRWESRVVGSDSCLEVVLSLSSLPGQGVIGGETIPGGHMHPP